jgi:hypothetical protein
MASINANAGGVPVSVTKQPDGTITFSADAWPGASFGPNNTTVPGHCGGTLDVTTIAGSIKTDQSRIEDNQYYINNALKQINDTTRNPPYDPAYIENLKSQVAGAEADIDVIRQSQSAWSSLQSQVSSLTDQVSAAEKADAPAGESQTNEEKNKADAQGVTNEPGTTAPDATVLSEASLNQSLGEAYGLPPTTSDPSVFKGESGKPAPDVPDSVTSSQAAQVAYDDDGNLMPGYEEDENGNAHYTADTPHKTIFKPADDGGGGDGTGASTRATGSVVAGKQPEPAEATWAGPKDMRVYIKVPSDYYANIFSKEVQKSQGILFPYTPSISYDTQASYGSVNPLHSNYTQYFFKNSAISAIQISGKFTVQNEEEATVWMSVVELSRMLLKMPFGDDKNSGSAPPVCRLHGYGDWIFNNIPVAITSFKFDLPDGVDYIAKSQNGYGNTMVPTVSTLTYGLIPLYSRKEIRDFGLDKWRKGELTGKGYL